MEQHFDFNEEEKLGFFGEGEWTKEPDRVIFHHEGICCTIRRVIAKEVSGHMFGGHLCGYCTLPEGHPWIGKGIDNIDAKVHGGLTYAEMDESNVYVIGFDCAHSLDLVPSVNKIRAKYGMREFILRTYTPTMVDIKVPVFAEESYKNIDFVVEQCKSLAEQIKAAICDT